MLVVDRDTPRRELRAYLTGTQLIREKDSYRTQSTPYDPTSTDVDYIINMMMFHEAAGGVGYTGLLHLYEGSIDFSRLLQTDQAILVCRPMPGRCPPRWDGCHRLLRHFRRFDRQRSVCGVSIFIPPRDSSGSRRHGRRLRPFAVIWCRIDGPLPPVMH